MAWWGVLWKKWNSWFFRYEGWNGLVPKWILWKSWCPKVLTSGGFAHDQVGRCTTATLDGLVGCLVKNGIRGFWDVKVGIVYQCPEMNTIKFLEHESLEVGGFCTWPSWSLDHDIGRLLGGLFCETMKFVVFEMWRLEWSTNVPKWIP